MELLRIAPGIRPHLQDRLLRSGMARVKALRHGGRMWAGTEIYWLRPGRADVGILELPAAGSGEVLVRSDLTAVSPGTERALLNLMPGTSARFPLRPGYSGVGTVVAVGSGVTAFKPGDMVACTETIYHASLALVRKERVFALPTGASAEDAAFLQLLIIAQQAIRKGRLKPGEKVAIVGAGLIGQLALQLARAWGAEYVAMVASSPAKRDLSLRCGAHEFISLADDPQGATGLASDVVIEVTGSPEALVLAAQAAAHSGRVVLLGSTRGVNRELDFDRLLRPKELSLIGAHISTVTDSAGPDSPPTYQDEAHHALALLAAGKLDVGKIITHRLNPLEAPFFYRDLCRGDRDVVGAVFDWKQLEDKQRCRRSFFLMPPRDLFRRGRAFDQNDGPPSVLRRPLPWLVHDVDALPSNRGVLRFGLIGCGGMGARHAEAIRSAPNTRLVATMDPDVRLASELASGAFYTTRVEDLLARDDIDAVLIATPNHFHDSIGIQAARAGKHIIVEKPMAPTLERADTFLAACREAGVALSVGYSFRYMPEIRVARRLVEQGVLGRLLAVQLTCYLDKPPSYYGSGYTNRVHSDWRASMEKSGGGVMIMNMSHQLDQLRYIVGRDLARVTSVSGTLDSPPWVQVEDVISVSGEFEGGAICNFFGTCFTRGIENQIEIRLLGDAGSIVLEQPFRFLTLRGMDGVAPGRWHAFGKLPKVDVHMMYLAWFADSVLRGERPELSGEDGRAVQAWMEATYESARRTCPVNVLPPSGLVSLSGSQREPGDRRSATSNR